MLDGWRHSNETRPIRGVVTYWLWLGRAMRHRDGDENAKGTYSKGSRYVCHCLFCCLSKSLFVRYSWVHCHTQLPELWLVGKGDSRDENPDFSVRRRFAKLYQVWQHRMMCKLAANTKVMPCHIPRHRTTNRPFTTGGLSCCRESVASLQSPCCSRGTQCFRCLSYFLACKQCMQL